MGRKGFFERFSVQGRVGHDLTSNRPQVGLHSRSHLVCNQHLHELASSLGDEFLNSFRPVGT